VAHDLARIDAFRAAVIKGAVRMTEVPRPVLSNDNGGRIDRVQAGHRICMAGNAMSGPGAGYRHSDIARREQNDEWASTS